MTPGARPRVVRDLHDWLRHILPDGHPLGGHSQRPCADRRAVAPAWPAGLPGRALRPLPPREIPVPESHLNLAEERLAEYRRDPSRARPARDVLDRLTNPDR